MHIRVHTSMHMYSINALAGAWRHPQTTAVIIPREGLGVQRYAQGGLGLFGK